MVSVNMEKLKLLAIQLCEINAVKFGDFEMKSGFRSPIYFDLRVIISYPDTMELLSNLLLDFIKEKGLEYDHVCGVPYTALPIATLVSIKDQKPMLIRRKETKSYGTKKLIEGKFKAGDKCLIIEDVVTSGSSILETAKDLQHEGLVTEDTIVVVNREQGGATNITNNGIRMHSLFTLSQLLNILQEAGKIDEKTVESVANYIANCQVDKPKQVNEPVRTKLTYSARAELTKCPIAKDLLNIIATKRTNLCLAADLTKATDILNLAESVGPYICILKTHVDIVDDFNDDFVNSLTALAKKHNFLLMEDRKFADIGNTVSLQYSSGLYHISKWAHLVTVHSLTGQSILDGLKSSLNNTDDKRGVFLLAEISSKDNLISPQYTENTIKLAKSSANSDFVVGIVGQSKDVLTDAGLLQLTPGCKIDELSDDLGQQYNSPEYIVKEKGADVIVVGRGITNANNASKSAKQYRDQLWAAYCDRVGIPNENK